MDVRQPSTAMQFVREAIGPIIKNFVKPSSVFRFAIRLNPLLAIVVKVQEVNIESFDGKIINQFVINFSQNQFLSRKC